MITIRLLGGARRALGGKTFVAYEKPTGTVSDILLFLEENATEPRLLDPANLIIAVNGVDSAALDGPNTVAKNGDTVTVVTVVHGGNSFRIGEMHFSAVGTDGVEDDDIGNLIDSTRRECGPVSVQVLDASCIFGEEHIVGVMRIVLEARKRNIMIADKVETELLVRVAFTDQISEAMSLAGMKTRKPSCFVGFSENATDVDRFTKYVVNHFGQNQGVLKRDSRKKKMLAKRLGLSESLGDDAILENLVERAALLAR